MTPGIHKNMTDADYFALDALSNSDLSSWVSKRKSSIKRADAVVGSMTHAACLLGIDRMTEDVIVVEDDSERLTQKRVDAYISGDEQGRRMVAKPKEVAQAQWLYDCVAQSGDTLARLQADMDHNEIAVVGHHKDKDSNPVVPTLCKAKLDCVRPQALVDLKTTSAPDADTFLQSIPRYRYHVQAAFYARMWWGATGDWKEFIFVCVSKETGQVWLQPVSWKMIWVGMSHLDDLLRLHAHYHPAEQIVGQLEGASDEPQPGA